MITGFCDFSRTGNTKENYVGLALFQNGTCFFQERMLLAPGRHQPGEYAAILFALETCQRLKLQNVVLFTDDLTTVGQLWYGQKTHVKNKPYKEKILKLLNETPEVRLAYTHARRNSDFLDWNMAHYVARGEALEEKINEYNRPQDFFDVEEPVLRKFQTIVHRNMSDLYVHYWLSEAVNRGKRIEPNIVKFWGFHFELKDRRIINMTLET